MKRILRDSPYLCLWLAFVISPSTIAFAADPPIVHQIQLQNGQTWCADSMIYGLFAQVNTYRTNNGRAALTMSTLGMKDAEIRATQVPADLAAGNPHAGWDTTAASLGYNIVSENLAWITTDPNYIVNAVWQDPLHIAAMLDNSANVMGVSCIYDTGTAYWTYEPGICTGSGCSAPPPTNPTLDSEESAFLTALNAYRAQNGVGPLQADVDLENAALWMSNDMVTNNYFGHTDSLGRSSGARLAAFGYTYSPWGEDLSAGYSDAQSALNALATACDPDASGTCTYAHRANLLGAGFQAVGIARVAGGGYGWYWTIDFGGYVEQAINPGTPGTPTIASFTATPSSVSAGQSATLSWTVSGATSIAIDNGVGDVSSVTSKTVSPAQTTTYTLTATNSSGSSVSLVTVTVTPADTQPPSAPVLTSAVAASSTEVDLAWTASTDNVGVTGYQVLRNGQVQATVSGATLSYADTTVSPSGSYTYAIRALDAAGNISPPSNSIPVTTPGGVCSVIPTGGFIGCYYNGIDLSGSPTFVRTDPQINFDWAGNSPDRSVGRYNFSVRWQGYFSFAQGTYTFSAVTSDGMRVYIDGNLVLDEWFNQAATSYTVQQTLSAGTHLITVEYYEKTGWSAAHLTWQSSAPVVQPPSILSFTATPSAVTAGQPATLTWSVSGPATVSIDNGVGDVSGTTSKTVLPTQTTTYTLTAN